MSDSDCSSFEVLYSDDEEFNEKMFVGEVKPETDDEVSGNFIHKKIIPKIGQKSVRFYSHPM